MNKIIPYSSIETISEKNETENPTVLVGGCFDFIHLGHVRFLQAAQKHGNVVVALEHDENVQRFKGKNRPFHIQAERAEMLAALECVSWIVLLPPLSGFSEYLKLVTKLHPAVICYTQGDTQKENKERQAKEIGAKLVEIESIATPSTTQLVKLLELEAS